MQRRREGGVARGLIDSISRGFHPTFRFVRPCIPVSTRPFPPSTTCFPLRFSKRSDRRVTGLHLADSFDRRSFSFSFLLLRRRCNSKDSMPSYEIHCHPITIIIESRLRISFRRYVIFSLRSIMPRGLWFRITSLRELEEELRNCNIYIKTRCIDFGLLFARNVFLYRSISSFFFPPLPSLFFQYDCTIMSFALSVSGLPIMRVSAIFNPRHVSFILCLHV